MPTSWPMIRNPEHFEASADTVHSSERSLWPFSVKSPTYRNDLLEDSYYNNDKWKYKEINEWSPADVMFWILNAVNELGERNPAALSLENFREINGRLLKKMCVGEWRHLIPEYGDKLYQRLQMKLASSVEGDPETIWRPLSPALSPIDQYVIINLDAQPQAPSHAHQTQAHRHLLSSDTASFLQPSEQSSIPASSLFGQSDPGYQYRDSLSEDRDNDSESSVEAEKPNPREKRPVGRPRKNSVKEKSHRKVGRVWEFIRDLLMDPQYNPSLMRWVNREEGLFRFENSDQVAKLWGLKRGNKHMNFEKFSRSVRHNYKKKYLLPMKNQRLVYKFGPMSYGWQQNPSYRQ